MKDSDRILEYLASPKREDKYHRTALDEVRLGDATTDQIAHYLACRRVMENHLDEESVFEELCRLAMQSDEETNDWFDRITREKCGNRARLSAADTMSQAEKLAAETPPIGGIWRGRLIQIAAGHARGRLGRT